MDKEIKVIGNERPRVIEYYSARQPPARSWKRSSARSSVVMGIMSWVAMAVLLLGAFNGVWGVMLLGIAMFMPTSLAAGCSAVSSLLIEQGYRRFAVVGLALAGMPWVIFLLALLAA